MLGPEYHAQPLLSMAVQPGAQSGWQAPSTAQHSTPAAQGRACITRQCRGLQQSAVQQCSHTAPVHSRQQCGSAPSGVSLKKKGSIGLPSSRSRRMPAHRLACFLLTFTPSTTYCRCSTCTVSQNPLRTPHFGLLLDNKKGLHGLNLPEHQPGCL